MNRNEKAAAGKVPAMVFNKADHIPERVSQEYADLMGKLRLRPQTVSKLFQQAVQVCPRISGLRQKALVSIIRQHLLQAIMPVHKDDHRAGTGPLQKYLNGKAEGGQLFVPLANLLARGFQRAMIKTEDASRFHPRQRGGALPDQHGLKGPG